MIYFDFREKPKNRFFFTFLVFSKIQNKSLQKLLFSNFGLIHTDVFFDEESESEVIFFKKWTLKGLKSSFFIESRFLKIDFPTKNRFFGP